MIIWSLLFGVIIGMVIMIFLVLYAMHKRFEEVESRMIDNTKSLLRELDSLKEKLEFKEDERNG